MQIRSEEVLCPQIVSTRRRPVNLHPDETKLFEHEFYKTIPPAKLLELKNVRVSPDGFLFHGLNLLPISFAFPYLINEWRLRSRIKFFTSNYLVTQKRRFQENALWIVDDWSYGYFHWLADALTRLYVVRDRLADVVLLLPHRYGQLEFVHATLKAFGVTKVKFILPDETLIVDNLIVPLPTAPSGHYREEIIRGVRELLLKHYGVQSETSRTRLYISRSGARKRRIHNEEAVRSLLKKFDFQVVRPEELTFAEQVHTASGGAFVISNHGAGLTNMLFMRPRGSVLELRHRTDRVNNCYYTMSSALDLNYFYQTCAAVNDGDDPHMADLVVDVELLRANLTFMLDSAVKTS